MINTETELVSDNQDIVLVNCDACDRNMTSSKGTTLTGVTIQFSDGAEIGLMEEIYPEVESGRKFRICLVCWLQSLGVKV